MSDDIRDDVEFEADDEFGDTDAAKVKVQKLRHELKEAQQMRDEYLAGWQRSKADMINARKDALAEGERRVARERRNLIEDFLPVLDSFDMALGADGWSESPDSWKSGMEQVRNQFLDTLAKHGIERFGKAGERFDPRFHEAVQETADAPGESHTIVRILRFGYRDGSHILRPAQVIIKA
jgi:molecular chaperone GrpE